MGDFNDNQQLDLISGFQPFNTKYSPFLKKLKPATQKKINDLSVGSELMSLPPKTCCLNYNLFGGKNFEGGYDRRGDYIMVDKSIQIKDGNHVPDQIKTTFDEVTSDHLPVLMRIDFNPSSSAKSSSNNSSPEVVFFDESDNSNSNHSVKTQNFVCVPKLFVAPKLWEATDLGTKKASKSKSASKSKGNKKSKKKKK